MADYSIDADEQTGIIRVDVTADTDEQLALELLGAARQAAVPLGIWRFLVDLRGTRNVASDFADYDLAYREFDRVGMHMQARIVLLVDADDRSRDFFAILATNAGYSLRVLADPEEGLEWLNR